ncbi:hypothetival protein [Planctomycetes bacterium Pan216]|uniref:Hypothetival protein n=1 Tax=Kolteria novifilia TaxID=2527975 RepID=A0A518B0T2_9BACT|nr:hypothetival protein [Planctomycetes bacterium Pan216]
MSERTGKSVYDMIGEDGFRRLIAAFYKQVPSDDLLGPMYPANDLDGAEERLRDFLIYRFGGPDKYIRERGHPRLRRRHFPFKVTPAARERWLELMDNAFAEAQLAPEAEAVLREFFPPTADFMINAE